MNMNTVVADPVVSTQVDDAAPEHFLTLPDGRTLAYSHSGPADSNTLVLWYHGLFSVGDASQPSKTIRQRGARFLAITLPGWGNTSPLLPHATFATTVVADTHALLEHLYPLSDPATATLRIYVAGGSFGTCPAQVVFGAPYAALPHGRQIVAVMLAAPFSPPIEDSTYDSALTWRDWLSVGAPSRILPFNLVLRAAKLAVGSKVKDVAAAEKMLRGAYFDNMKEEERAQFAAWRERNGVPEGRFERRMAEGMVKSVSKSWAGFLWTARALHEDWGYRIDSLDEHHQRKLVMIAVGKDDTSMYNMSKYLLNHYKRTKVIEYEGGHLSGAWGMDKIWEEVFAEVERGDSV